MAISQADVLINWVHIIRKECSWTYHTGKMMETNLPNRFVPLSSNGRRWRNAELNRNFENKTTLYLKCITNVLTYSYPFQRWPLLWWFVSEKSELGWWCCGSIWVWLTIQNNKTSKTTTTKKVYHVLPKDDYLGF